MGVTPNEYYIHLRIERARILLRQTSLQVSTIAYSCGFSSQAVFARVYRKHFELPPSKDREV
jgi:transcriptional regulator GlxA family with amidase domain